MPQSCSHSCRQFLTIIQTLVHTESENAPLLRRRRLRHVTFEKGSTGFSYSLRDFSVPNHVTERYASDFGWTADEIRQKATHIYDAPFLDVTKLADWHAYTVGLNRLHGLQESRVQPQAVATPSASAAHIEG